ncbi:MAG: hypothetical protein LBR20_06295, partial [Propionibacteriaceae bacterium]|nr:hypothetical protein [Propionibacteriaceae bacterium]
MSTDHRRIKRLGRLGVVLATSAALLAPFLGSVQSAAAPPTLSPSVLDPVDPISPVEMEDMTWDDYVPLPDITLPDGTKKYDWAHKTTGSTRPFYGAIVLVRFQNRDFIVTQTPDDTKPFAAPNTKLAAAIPTAADGAGADSALGQYYLNLLNNPEPTATTGSLNNGRTINEYWMEQSAGRLSVQMEVYGPYTLEGDYEQYGFNDSMDMTSDTGTYRITYVPKDNLDKDGDGDTEERGFLLNGTQAPSSTNALLCPAKYYDGNHQVPSAYVK